MAFSVVVIFERRLTLPGGLGIQVRDEIEMRSREDETPRRLDINSKKDALRPAEKHRRIVTEVHHRESRAERLPGAKALDKMTAAVGEPARLGMQPS